MNLSLNVTLLARTALLAPALGEVSVSLWLDDVIWGRIYEAYKKAQLNLMGDGGDFFFPLFSLLASRTKAMSWQKSAVLAGA